jgi:hypothetical protein
VHDLDDPALARLTREARYETLTGLAAGNLRAGRPVVLVAPFSTERAHPSAWATTTRLLEAEPTLVWLHLPPDELVRRLTGRGEARDENKIRDPTSFLTALDLAPRPSRTWPSTPPTSRPPRCRPSLPTFVPVERLSANWCNSGLPGIAIFEEARPSGAIFRLSWWIGATWSIGCTIDPLINRRAPINHAN